MDYNQHVILFNNLLVYFDSIISALYHSCSQTRFSADCHAVEDRLKHNLSKFSSLQASISCGAYISTDSPGYVYQQLPQNLQHPQQPHHAHPQPHYTPYIPPHGQYYGPAYPPPGREIGGTVYYNNNSEQDEEYSSQETELSSTEADAHHQDEDDQNVRVASFVTVSSPTDGSSRSTTPETEMDKKSMQKSPKPLNDKPTISQDKQEDHQSKTNMINNNKASILLYSKVTGSTNETSKRILPKPEVTLQKPSKPIVDNEGFILVNSRIQKARERRERILQKRREIFRSTAKKTEIIKTETRAQKENLGQTIEERQKKAEQKRNEIQLQKIRKAQAEDDKIKINSLVASFDAQSKKGSLHLKDASSSRRIEEVKARKWQQFALKDALFNARREYCETKELERREQIKSQSQMKLMKAEEARREKIESTVRKEKSWAEKTNAIKKRKEKENAELKKKIEDKISQQQKRYEENLEQKRQKAFELSVRSSLLVNSENALLCESYTPGKVCKLCAVKIKSEVYLFGHMQSRLHCDMFEKHLKTLKTTLTLEENDSLNMSFIVDDLLPDSMDVKEDYGRRNVRFIKKLKGFLVQEAEKFEKDSRWSSKSTSGDKVETLVGRIEEALKKESFKVLPTRIELLLAELSKNRTGSVTTLKVLVQSLRSLSDKAAFDKCYTAIAFHFELSSDFRCYLSRSSLVMVLVELFDQKLDHEADDGLEVVFRLVKEIVCTKQEDRRFAENVVNYLFSIGIFEKLCNQIKHHRFEGSHRFLLTIIDLLESLSITAFASSSLFQPEAAIKNTQFAGLVSWMYEMVFRTGSSIRNEEIAEKFSDEKLRIVVRIFEMFIRFPREIVQTVLGQEGISLQIRHLCSFLIWTMKSPPKNSKIDIILEFISHFTIHNPDNQTLLRCGASPTVLEQLVQMDISYFIGQPHNRKSAIVPALIGLCYENADNFAIMCHDLSPVFVTEFIDDHQRTTGDQSTPQLLGLDATQIGAIRDYFAYSPTPSTPAEAS